MPAFKSNEHHRSLTGMAMDLRVRLFAREWGGIGKTTAPCKSDLSIGYVAL